MGRCDTGSLTLYIMHNALQGKARLGRYRDMGSPTPPKTSLQGKARLGRYRDMGSLTLPQYIMHYTNTSNPPQDIMHYTNTSKVL